MWLLIHDQFEFPVMGLAIWWTLIGVFAMTVLLTLAWLVGLVKFANPRHQWVLLALLTLEVAAVGTSLLKSNLPLSPRKVGRGMVALYEQYAEEFERELQAKEEALVEKDKQIAYYKDEFDGVTLRLDASNTELADLKKALAVFEPPDPTIPDMIERMKADLLKAQTEAAEAKDLRENLTAKIKELEAKLRAPGSSRNGSSKK